jgi:hypothetical protein
MTGLKRDLSDLPVARGTTDKAWAPDDDPTFGRLVFDAWHELEMLDDGMPMAAKTARFRHSMAGACARAVAYRALGIEPSNPLDAVAHYVVHIGNLIHQDWQRLLQMAYPDAQIETKVVSEDGSMAGHVDGYLDQLQQTIAIEGKSVGGYAFKLAVGCPPASRVPQGPKFSHVLQGALNGLRLDADLVKIIYWSKEPISVSIARDRGFDDVQRVIAEWTLTREQYEPLARKEEERIQAILALVDEGTLPRRRVPDPDMPLRHLIVRPEDGSYVGLDEAGQISDTGRYWGCDYCPWQDYCVTRGAEQEPIMPIDVARDAGD